MANVTIKTQNFGVEIELTGITRSTAAEVIAKHFGTHSFFIGGAYNAYGAKDTKNRTWKVVRDASIKTEKKVGNTITHADVYYSSEVVTPILQYDDMEDLQQIIRELVEKKAFANQSCGIHVHVDGANHNVDSLIRLINFAVGRQDLFYEALQIGQERMNKWCKKMNKTLLMAMKKDTIKSKASMEEIWYSKANDGYIGGVDHQHYNPTRYHGINLHAFFTKGTVEFRLFNGTAHAGKIKAYIQFCLAMSAWAINAKNDMHFTTIKCQKYQSKEQRGKLMLSVLTNRLGLVGKEFETCRFHLTKAFGQSEESVA